MVSGLLWQAPWARLALSRLLGLMAIFLPLVLFNPFAALERDGLFGNLSTPEILVRFISAEAGLLIVVWLLDPSGKAQPNKSAHMAEEVTGKVLSVRPSIRWLLLITAVMVIAAARLRRA